MFSMMLRFAVAFLILSSQLAITNNLFAGQQVGPLPHLLELSKPIEAKLARGESHHYLMELVEGQYAQLKLEKRTSDLALAVSRPDGENITDARGAQPHEPLGIVFLAHGSGKHRVEVRSLGKEETVAAYRLSIVELRAATEYDRTAVAAARAYTEGMRLVEKGATESLRQSIAKFQEAVSLYKVIEKRADEAGILAKIGSVYRQLKEPRKTLEYLGLASSIYRELGERNSEAIILGNLGHTYHVLGETETAIEHFKQALALYRSSGDRAGEAGALDNIGRIYDTSGDKQRALDFFNQALDAHRAAGNRRDEAIILHLIAAAHSSLNHRAEALDAYNQTLAAYRVLGDRKIEAQVLGGIAQQYSSTSDHRKALDFNNQALKLYRQLGDRRGEALALYRMGTACSSLNEYENALDHYNQALRPLSDLNEKRIEAALLSGIGRIYLALGDYDSASHFLEESAKAYAAAKDLSGQASAFSNIAVVHLRLSEYRKALELNNDVLGIVRGLRDQPSEAATLANIGGIHALLGNSQKSIDFYSKSLAISRSLGRRRGEGVTLNNIGRAYLSLGDAPKALDYHQQALEIIRALGNRRDEAQVLYNLGRAHRALGNLAEARSKVDEAIRLAESLRYEVASQQLRATFFASVRDFFDFKIDILMQLHKQRSSDGFDRLALEASERARGRSLLELLAEARADVREGADPALVERERSLGLLLNTKAEQQAELLGSKHSPEQAAAAAREIETIIIQHQQVESQIKNTNPRYAALTQPQPISFKTIQDQVVDRDTLLLEYTLGKERSYLWALSSDQLTSYELPGHNQIVASARKFFELARKSSDVPGGEKNGRVDTDTPKGGERTAGENATPHLVDLDKAAHELSRMLLGPVAGRLQSKRLAIVADGILHYVPFAALPKPAAGGQQPAVTGAKSHPMIVDHEIVMLPSASVLAEVRRDHSGRRPSAKAVAVFADPVFSRDDPRLKATSAPAPEPGQQLSTRTLQRAMSDLGFAGAGAVFPRLPFSRREADAIAATAPRGESSKSLDFQASRSAATSDELRNYRIVHFATHGVLNSSHPELSGLVLSLVDSHGQPQNGFLRLHDIYNMKLPAELVVLSACQTGLGKEIRGEGLVGLTRGFMYAGAPRLVASLWKVDDAATAELMKRFYRGMLRKGLRPAAALREAQVQMWNQERWKSPYYWAAFALQGEWR